jgi:hypothetical protein
VQASGRGDGRSATPGQGATQASRTKSGAKTTSSASASSGTSARKSAAGGRSAARKISPAQALRNTRALLEAKNARARETPAWQAMSGHGEPVPQPGFQSDEARVQANALHQEEADLDAIQGNISSRDRRNQGKRDNR